MGIRVTYRRRNSYNTRSNKVRKVKTPGELIALIFKAAEWSCNTRIRAPSLSFVLTLATLSSSTVSRESDPTSGDNWPEEIGLNRDPMEEFLAQPPSKTELSEHSLWRKSRSSNKSKNDIL